MPKQYRIESIEKPTQYWTDRGWSSHIAQARVYTEEHRSEDTRRKGTNILGILPHGGCWVLINPKPETQPEPKTCSDCKVVAPNKLCDRHARVDALIKAARAALEYVDDMAEDLPLSPSCNQCTEGSTPARYDEGLCWVHLLRAALAEKE